MIFIATFIIVMTLIILLAVNKKMAEQYMWSLIVLGAVIQLGRLVHIW